MNKHRAYIFDLDGTLANSDHRVHYILDPNNKRWDLFFKEVMGDTPIYEYIRLLQALVEAGEWCIILTARPEMCRKDTQAWVNRYVFPDLRIIMREDEDRTDDHLLKPLLLKKLEKENIFPIIIFEDRTRIVQSLREHGYKVAQVAQGDF